MKQKSVGLTLRAAIIALALILVAGSPALPPFDGVAYAQDAPQNLVATRAPDNASVSLTWDAVSGADSYEVWRGDGSGGSVSWPSSALATGETGTTYRDSTVTAGNTYSYAVRAVAGGTTGAFSNVPSVTLGTPTAAPSGAPNVSVAADGLTAVNVTWNTVTGADSYQIQFWHAGLDDWEQISGDQTSPYNHTGLTAGTQYYYVVRGSNAGGNGPWSNWRTDDSQITLQATTSVPVVTLTRVDRTTVTISWTSTGSAEYDLQRRRIDVSNDGQTTNTGTWARLPSALLTVTSYTDSGANYIPTDAQSVKYEYRVQAVDTQAWSSVKSITVPKLGAVVGTPQSLRAASISDSSIRISWGAVTGADFYQLQWKTGTSSYTSPVRIDALFYEHTGLSPSTRYTYQVRAVDVNGAGDWSSEGSSSTRSVGSSGLQVPKVTGLVVTDATSDQAAAPRSAKLTWNAVSDATHYDIQRYDPTTATAWEVLGTGGALTTVGTASRIVKPSSSPPSYTDTFDTAAHGKTYFYVVSAVKQVGDASVPATDEMGEWSDYKSVTFKFLPPPTPATLTAQMTSGTSIWVSWTAGTANAGDNPPTDAGTSYTLEWRTDETSTWNRIPVPSGTTHHHTGLSSSSAYRYRVRAENTGGSSDSEPAGTDGFRVELGNRLSPPSGVTAADATTGEIGSEVPGIKVSWNAVSGATGYEIQRYDTTDTWGMFDGSDGEETVDGQATTSITHTGTGVAAEATNIYRVRTVQSETKSDWSAPVSGTARAAIVAATTPTLVAASTGTSMIRLSWTEVDGATNYELRFVEGNQTTTANIDLINPTPVTLSGSHRNYVHRSLKAGQLYSYQIRALFGANAMTAWSTVAQQITKPSAPDLSTTNVTASSITLTWSATSFNGERLTAAENYHIQRRVTGGDWESVIGGAGNVANNAVTCTNNVCELLDDGADGDSSGTDDGLSAGTTYYYRIRATDSRIDAPTGTFTSYWDYINQTTPSQ